MFRPLGRDYARSDLDDKAAWANKLPLAANERYAPKESSVTGPVPKLIAASPMRSSSALQECLRPSREPLVDHGYKGRLYFNHGVADNDFRRVGGQDVEGAFVPASR
jgi:branched-chain amino acid transport system substrate-binding protein